MWKILWIFTIWQIWTTDVIYADNYELPLWPLLRKIEPREQQTEDEFYSRAYSYFIPSSTLDKDVKGCRCPWTICQKFSGESCDGKPFKTRPCERIRKWNLTLAYSPIICKCSDDPEEFQLQPLQSKRGFTLLARWRPFNNIGKNRASIREHNTKMKTLLDQDVVMETRAHSRPAGQPLRWGK